MHRGRFDVFDVLEHSMIGVCCTELFVRCCCCCCCCCIFSIFFLVDCGELMIISLASKHSLDALLLLLKNYL